MSRTLAAAEVFALTICFVWLVFVGPLAWALRDGLGQRAVTSHGLHAMVRFGHSLHFLAISVLLGVATVVIDRMRVRAESSSASA